MNESLGPVLALVLIIFWFCIMVAVFVERAGESARENVQQKTEKTEAKK